MTRSITGIKLPACLARAFEFALAAMLAFATPPPEARAAAATDMPTAVTSFHCPGSLGQQAVADALPAGWSIHGRSAELLLQRAAFYDGDPAGLGTLAPETTRRSGLTETSTWSFADSNSEHVWLGCLYRDATAVVARPLPVGLRQCTTVLRLTPLGDPSEAVSVQCR